MIHMQKCWVHKHATPKQIELESPAYTVFEDLSNAPDIVYNSSNCSDKYLVDVIVNRRIGQGHVEADI